MSWRGWHACVDFDAEENRAAALLDRHERAWHVDAVERLALLRDDLAAARDQHQDETRRWLCGLLGIAG